MKNGIKETAFLRLHHNLVALERAYQIRMEYKAAGNTDTPSYKGNETLISKKLIEITCLMELLDLDLKNHLELLYNMYND